MSEKIALVTGASRGIGQAIAKSLANEGYRVIGTATSEQGAHAITTTLKESQGVGIVLRLDDTDAMDDQLRMAFETMGHPSVLVNNAGINEDNLFIRMKAEQWQNVINVNLTGVFHLTQCCLKSMMKARHGRIISISSVVGVTGNAGQANYAAAKAGVIGMSKSLALEVASRGVTVNVVAPGFIETDMTAALSEELSSAIVSRIPMGRVGRCDDIASAVVYLASDQANYVTGTTLHVNGGFSMV